MGGKPRGRARVWAILIALSAIVAVVLVVVYLLRPNLGARTTASGLQTTTYHPADDDILFPVVARDGSLWFAEQRFTTNGVGGGNDRIGHITAAGKLDEISLHPGAGFLGTPSLVIGSDGNPWFTEEIAVSGGLPRDAVGRIDARGTITDYVLPFPASLLGPGWATQLTLGADGNIWFGLHVVTHQGTTPATTTTELELASITPTGAVTAVPLTPPATELGYSFPLTLGPDGDFWTASQSAPPPPAGSGSPTTINAVLRITPAGVVSRYPLPTPGVFPARFTVGADGNLWFVELTFDRTQQLTGAGTIARITPSGHITEFAVTARQRDLLPDLTWSGNALWFVMETGTAACYRPSASASSSSDCQVVQSFVGQLAPDGAVSLVAVPRPSAVAKLFAGPGGNLYYVGQQFPGGQGNNRLGRVSSSGQVTEYPVQTDKAGDFTIVAGTGNTLWLIEVPGPDQTGSAIVHITLPQG